MSQPSQYVHGTGQEEQQRLTRLNDLINAASLRELNPQPGERILDFGSGLGQLSRAMARLSGVPVVGIERSADQIREALDQAEAAGERELLDLRQADVFSELALTPTEWGQFDVAHARFLLEHVPYPEAIVRTMVRAVRPGGRIVLEDDDHDVLRLWPEPPGVRVVWDAYVRTYDRLGNDPYIGRRLVQLLHDAGARPRRSTWVYFGSCSGRPEFPDYVRNLAGLFIGARELVQACGITTPQFEDALDALDVWERRPDAAFWYAYAWAEAVRP